MLPRTEALRKLAAELNAGKAAYGTLYRALCTGVYRTMAQTAEAAGLSVPQTRCGMHAFRQLNLIEMTETPFRYHLLPRPAEKRPLENSPVMRALCRMTEDDDERRGCV